MDRRTSIDGNVGEGRIKMEGTFFPAGTGAPTGQAAASAAAGPGWTVARTGVGVFTITLADKWLVLENKQLTLQLSTPAARLISWGNIDLVATRTLIINVTDAAAAAQDIAANANNSISFSLTFRTLSVLP